MITRLHVPLLPSHPSTAPPHDLTTTTPPLRHTTRQPHTHTTRHPPHTHLSDTQNLPSNPQQSLSRPHLWATHASISKAPALSQGFTPSLALCRRRCSPPPHPIDPLTTARAPPRPLCSSPAVPLATHRSRSARPLFPSAPSAGVLSLPHVCSLHLSTSVPEAFPPLPTFAESHPSRYRCHDDSTGIRNPSCLLAASSLCALVLRHGAPRLHLDERLSLRAL